MIDLTHFDFRTLAAISQSQCVCKYVVATNFSRRVWYSAVVRGTLDKLHHVLNWERRTRLLFQVASALSFLHQPVPHIRL